MICAADQDVRDSANDGLAAYLAGEMTDTQWDLADPIEAVLRADPAKTWTISELARKVKADYQDTSVVIRWMVRHQFVLATGNGAWTRYLAR